MWPFKEGEVKKTLDQLRQFQQRLSSTLNIDQTRLTLTIHSRVVGMCDVAVSCECSYLCNFLPFRRRTGI
ncbi:hypothetical protein JB92DRAFT_2906739, partial [Gautieria morchelliformis]